MVVRVPQGRQTFTILIKNDETKVPQGGVLSLTLFNLYMSGMPIPSQQSGLHLTTLPMIAQYQRQEMISANLQETLKSITGWEVGNYNFHLKNKRQHVHKKVNTQQNIRINNKVIPSVKKPQNTGYQVRPLLMFNIQYMRVTGTKN